MAQQQWQRHLRLATVSQDPDRDHSGNRHPNHRAILGDVDTRVDPTKPAPFFDQVWYDVDSVNGVFTATWDQVGYYREHTDPTNSFQLQLISLGNGDFDIVFRYQSIGWTTGDASEGKDGLGGLVARAGYSADTGKSTDFFELPQSGNQDAMLGLPSASNRGIPGVFVFNVANAVFRGGETGPQRYVSGRLSLSP